jgi:6-phosphogluconolactonase
VDASGKYLFGAHYGEGEVSVWKINAERQCTGEVSDQHKTATHAHFITTDPTNRFVYVPHTQSNAIFQFAFDAEGGKLTPLDPPLAMGPDSEHQYHQPRHYAHHPTLAMGFTANERGGGISSWKFDSLTGQLSLQKTLSTLPLGWEGNTFAADIKLTPNGRFAYVSNRDGRKLEADKPYGDSLASFAIDLTTGDMQPIGHTTTARFPRSFCIDTSGNFIYVACELSHQLEAFRVDQNTGTLEKIATYATGKTPIWVLSWND